MIPECDLDQYSPQLNIDVATYAKNAAKSFVDNQTQNMAGVNNDEEGTISSKTEQTPASTSDGQNLSQGRVATPPDKQAGVTAARALSDNSALAQNADQPA